MEIQLIKDLSSFKRIRKEWESIYKEDKNAQIYISWLWLYCSFLDTSDKWVIIGVKDKPEGSFIAFLPLEKGAGKLSDLLLIRKYIYPGNPISSYSGFLCRPHLEEKAILMLAAYIQSTLKWDKIYLKWVKDTRIQYFLSNFPKSNYLIDARKELSSLRITLPDNYDTFLSKNLSRESKKNIRRQRRRLVDVRKCMIVNATAETIDRDINAICNLWNEKWQKKHIMERHMDVLDQFFNEGKLKLLTIWDGEVIVAGAARIMDPPTSSYNAYISAYNPIYSKYSPGKVVFAETIKLAIQEGYNYFDLTIGLDPHKTAFGPEQIELTSVTIEKRDLKTRLKQRLLRAIQNIKR